MDRNNGNPITVEQANAALEYINKQFGVDPAYLDTELAASFECLKVFINRRANITTKRGYLNGIPNRKLAKYFIVYNPPEYRKNIQDKYLSTATGQNYSSHTEAVIETVKWLRSPPKGGEKNEDG